jgi:nucleoside 2-deoxyribosyltransferase
LENKGYDIIDPLDRKTSKCSFDHRICYRDLDLLKACDAVFCYFPRNRHSKIGTAIEMGWGYAADKYVMVLSKRMHPFITTFADIQYKSIKGLIKDDHIILDYIRDELEYHGRRR